MTIALYLVNQTSLQSSAGVCPSQNIELHSLERRIEISSEVYRLDGKIAFEAKEESSVRYSIQTLYFTARLYFLCSLALLLTASVCAHQIYTLWPSLQKSSLYLRISSILGAAFVFLYSTNSSYQQRKQAQQIEHNFGLTKGSKVVTVQQLADWRKEVLHPSQSSSIFHLPKDILCTCMTGQEKQALYSTKLTSWNQIFTSSSAAKQLAKMLFKNPTPFSENVLAFFNAPKLPSHIKFAELKTKYEKDCPTGKALDSLVQETIEIFKPPS